MSTDRHVRDAYDARAVEYTDQLGSLDRMAAADAELIARWRDATPGRLLDAGCGPGHWTDFLHDDDRDVLGVDLSAVFVEGARARYPHLAFHHGSLRDAPVEPGSLGGVLAWYSLVHTPPATVPAVLRDLAGYLRPGGQLLLGYFDGEPGEPFAHRVVTAYEWSAEWLGVALDGADFRVVEQHARQDAGSRPHGAVWARLVQ